MAELRRARPGDADAIADLEQQIYGGDAWSAQTVAGELVREDRYYVVIEGERMQGYAGVFLSRPDADVQTMTVAPQWRRQGLGWQLLTHILDQLREWQFSRVFLEVKSTNIAALHLYSDAGFRRIGLRRDYYADGADAVNMRLRLGSAPSLGA